MSTCFPRSPRRRERKTAERPEKTKIRDAVRVHHWKRTNWTRRSLEEAKPARTLNDPLPPRFHPNFDLREIQLLGNSALALLGSFNPVVTLWKPRSKLHPSSSSDCQGSIFGRGCVRCLQTNSVAPGRKTFRAVVRDRPKSRLIPLIERPSRKWARRISPIGTWLHADSHLGRLWGSRRRARSVASDACALSATLRAAARNARTSFGLDSHFLDAKVENLDGKKNIVILSSQACRITANSRFRGIYNWIPPSISPSVTTLAKNYVSGLPLTQSVTPDARSRCSNADMTSVSLTYIQKVTSRGLTCARSISQPGKDNR